MVLSHSSLEFDAMVPRSLERAGVRGGGGALFTAHDIRAAGTDCTQACLINRGMLVQQSSNSSFAANITRYHVCAQKLQ